MGLMLLLLGKIHIFSLSFYFSLLEVVLACSSCFWYHGLSNHCTLLLLQYSLEKNLGLGCHSRRHCMDILTASLQCFVLENLLLQNTTQRMTEERETEKSLPLMAQTTPSRARPRVQLPDPDPSLWDWEATGCQQFTCGHPAGVPRLVGWNYLPVMVQEMDKGNGWW